MDPQRGKKRRGNYNLYLYQGKPAKMPRSTRWFMQKKKKSREHLAINAANKELNMSEVEPSHSVVAKPMVRC